MNNVSEGKGSHEGDLDHSDPVHEVQSWSTKLCIIFLKNMQLIYNIFKFYHNLYVYSFEITNKGKLECSELQHQKKALLLYRAWTLRCSVLIHVTYLLVFMFSVVK